jgi:hypothetical protein
MPFGLNVLIKNVGKIPVTVLAVGASSGLAETPKDRSQEEQIIGELSRVGKTIPRNGTIPPVASGKDFSFSLEGPTLSSHMLEALKAGKYTVYYTGIISGNASAFFCLRMSGDLTRVHACVLDQHAFGFGEFAEPGKVTFANSENPKIDFRPQGARDGEKVEFDSSPENMQINVSGKGGHETRLEIDELRLRKMRFEGTYTELMLIVSMKNVGSVPAHNLYVFGSSGVAGTPQDNGQENDVIRELSEEMLPREPKTRSSEVAKVIPKSRFSFTFRGPVLDPESFQDLQESKYIVYYTGIVLGNAITRFCFYTSGSLSRMHNCTPDRNAVKIDENASPGSQVTSKPSHHATFDD